MYHFKISCEEIIPQNYIIVPQNYITYPYTTQLIIYDKRQIYLK